MKDIYTKSVFTVIAICLCVLVAQNAGDLVIENAYASDCPSSYEIKRIVKRIVRNETLSSADVAGIVSSALNSCKVSKSGWLYC